ncbi:MAG TPA: hypothetical protein VMV18_01850 [bacterium]|nr:hypothetical protein [bacterium]
MSAAIPPTPPPPGEDAALTARFAALEPHPTAIVRMGSAIEARLVRLARPLWREWLALLASRPVAAPALAAAAFVFVIFTTPAGIAVGLVARALAGSAGAGPASAHAAARLAPSAHRAEAHAHHHAVVGEGDRRG